MGAAKAILLRVGPLHQPYRRVPGYLLAFEKPEKMWTGDVAVRCMTDIELVVDLPSHPSEMILDCIYT